MELRKALGGTVCTKLQHEVQKAIILHKWGLENLKFQQRLKKFPKFIVTIQSIEPAHEPLVELKCPGGTGPHFKDTPNLEFYFHETRFQAASVRLFDIQSIFPIHTGSMSVKIKLDHLVVTLDKLVGVGGRVGAQIPGINNVYYAASQGNSDFAKEHREDSAEAIGGDGLLEIEKEIEGLFINRIKPDVQKQLKTIVTGVVRKFFAQNLFRV